MNWSKAFESHFWWSQECMDSGHGSWRTCPIVNGSRTLGGSPATCLFYYLVKWPGRTDSLYCITTTLFKELANWLFQIPAEKSFCGRITLPGAESWHLILFEKWLFWVIIITAPCGARRRSLLLLVFPLPKSKCWVFPWASIKDPENFSEGAVISGWCGISSHCGWAWSEQTTAETSPASYSLYVGLRVTQTERYVYPKLAGALYSRANFVNSGEITYLLCMTSFLWDIIFVLRLTWLMLLWSMVPSGAPVLPFRVPLQSTGWLAQTWI